MARVLLTGASSYIGGKLGLALQKVGHEILAVSRSENTEYEFTPVKKIQYQNSYESLAEGLHLQKVDVVIHLAAMTSPEISGPDIDRMVHANITFGSHLLELAKLNNCRGFISTGTYWQFKSKTEPVANTFYAATKSAFEAVLRYYQKLAGVNILQFRLYDVYGPDDNRQKLIPILLKNIREPKTLELSPGDQKLSLVHVDDLTNAYLMGVDSLLQGRVYQEPFFDVRGSELFSLKEVVGQFERAFDVSLDCQWGAKSYREFEIMEPVLHPTLPGWAPKISLLQGFEQLALALGAQS